VVRINSSIELGEFLSGKPASWALIISSRCALRALPSLNAVSSRKNFRADILLPLCRGVATSACVATWPLEIELVATANATKKALDAAANKLDAAADPAVYAANAINSAAVAAAHRRDGDRSHAIQPAAHAAAHAANASAADEVWDAVSSDLTSLHEDSGSIFVMQFPLWLDRIPYDVQTQWLALKTSLPKSGNWWVWTNWYEGQLTGARNRNKALEVARISISNEDWQRGAAHVNQIIADIEREHAEPEDADIDAASSQNPIATQFAESETGRTGLESLQPSLNDEQRSFHTALCDAIREAIRDTGFRGENQFPKLIETANDLLKALGTTVSEIDHPKVWTSGNRLRRYMKADARLHSSRDPDREPLPIDISEGFSRVVDEYNVFASGDEVLRKFDTARRGPEIRDLEEALSDARELDRAFFQNSDVFETDATNAIHADIENVARMDEVEASDVSNIDVDQAKIRAVETAKNAIRATVRRVWKFTKTTSTEAKSGIVGSGATLTVSSMWANRDALFRFLDSSVAQSGLKDLITRLFQLFGF